MISAVIYTDLWTLTGMDYISQLALLKHLMKMPKLLHSSNIDAFLAMEKLRQNPRSSELQ
jgi:hypothetical protein